MVYVVINSSSSKEVVTTTRLGSSWLKEIQHIPESWSHFSILSIFCKSKIIPNLNITSPMLQLSSRHYSHRSRIIIFIIIMGIIRHHSILLRPIWHIRTIRKKYIGQSWIISIYVRMQVMQTPQSVILPHLVCLSRLNNPWKLCEKTKDNKFL